MFIEYILHDSMFLLGFTPVPSFIPSPGHSLSYCFPVYLLVGLGARREGFV
jgi:hypothetical protein